MWKAGGEFLKLMGQGIETLRCAPGIDRGFGAVQDTVDDSRDCRRRTFRDAPARSKHRDHGAFLAFAPILPKDDPPPARELDHFLFQDLGPLIELKLGEALGENRLDLIKRMRL